MKFLQLTIGIWMVAGCAQAQQLRLSPVTFENTEIAATMLEIPLARFSVRVLSTNQLVQNRGLVDRTLVGLGDLLSTYASTEEFALTSAGFSGIDARDPMGLLVDSGLIISPLLWGSRERDELSGVLCVTSVLREYVKIIPVEEFRNNRSQCFGAVQAGPILVGGDRGEGESLTYGRGPWLIACVGKEADDMLYFYYVQSAPRFILSRALQGRCRSAINVGRPDQAGMILWQKRATRVGEFSRPLVAVIQVVPRH